MQVGEGYPGRQRALCSSGPPLWGAAEPGPWGLPLPTQEGAGLAPHSPLGGVGSARSRWGMQAGKQQVGRRSAPGTYFPGAEKQGTLQSGPPKRAPRWPTLSLLIFLVARCPPPLAWGTVGGLRRAEKRGTEPGEREGIHAYLLKEVGR